MAETIAARFVPGAPPSTAASKTQKKKRKTKTSNKDATNGGDSPTTIPKPLSSALIDTAPSTEKDNVAPGLLVSSEPEPSATPFDEEDGFKRSPLVDLVHKRLKAIHKKIARISTYSSMETSLLNEDQVRTLTTLPSLEAVQKELEEVKKAIEVHEAEIHTEIANKRAQAERDQKRRAADVISAAHIIHLSKTSDLLTFLRLRSALLSTVGASEAFAVSSVTEILLGENGEKKDAIIHAFFSGEGEYEGVSYPRLIEISQSILYPSDAAPPTSAGDAPSDNLAGSYTELNSDEHDRVPIAVNGPISGSFHFMQASELEEASAAEDAEEWVEAAPEVPATTTSEVNGARPISRAVVAEIFASNSGPIDWAEDEGDHHLPSVEVIQARLSSTSGDVTPTADQTTSAVASSVEPNHDGFQQAGGRGSGKGRTGYRGAPRGFERGQRGRGNFSERGGAHFDHRGRGRGAFRGGDGGPRGSSDGPRARGGLRGRTGAEGGYRGAERGGSDWRESQRGRPTRGRGEEAARGAAPP